MAAPAFRYLSPLGTGTGTGTGTVDVDVDVDVDKSGCDGCGNESSCGWCCCCDDGND